MHDRLILTIYDDLDDEYSCVLVTHYDDRHYWAYAILDDLYDVDTIIIDHVI